MSPTDPTPPGGKEESSFRVVDRRRAESEAPSEGAHPASKSAAEPATTASPSAAAVDFSTFILSLSANALYHFGSVQDPHSGRTSKNLELAKQTIDIIAMLKAKSEGNRSEDETALLDHTLYDLRMRYLAETRRRDD